MYEDSNHNEGQGEREGAVFEVQNLKWEKESCVAGVYVHAMFEVDFRT